MPAVAVGQLSIRWLTNRYRWQASSYKDLRRGLEGDRLAPGKRVRQGPAIHQFQFTTQRHAMGDA